jgi:hypothetical protein
MASKLSTLISALTGKTTPVDADKIPILNSENSFNHSWLSFTQLKVYLSSALANVRIFSTTEQLRLGYDASNYASFTVDSVGNLTLDTVGNTVYTPDIIENTTAGGGIILKSPNGTRYRITVANGGTLSVATV